MKEYEQIKTVLDRMPSLEDKLNFLKFLAFVEDPCHDAEKLSTARKRLEEELLSQDEADSDASDFYPRYF